MAEIGASSLVRQRFSVAALWIAVALGFSIPVSTALDEVLLMLFTLCWLASGRFREKWVAIRSNPFALAVCAFFLLHAFGALYGLGPTSDHLHALNKAGTMLLVPMLVSLQPANEWRRHALISLFAALAITLVLSFPLWLGILPDFGFIKGHPFDPVIFKKKIGHSVLMAYGAFALAVIARDRFRGWTRVLLYIVAGIAAFNVLFMVWGRTGQLVLLAMLLYLLVVSFGWRGLLAASGAGLLIGAVAYLSPSSSLHVRTLATIHQIDLWREGRPPDIGNMRLETWTNSVELVRQHPVIGVGTGGFASAYEKHVAGTGMMKAENPENQYLLTTVQLGVVGLAALLAFFAFQWRWAGRLATRTDVHLARGLVILMVVGCAFNSFLSDHTQALFYAWLSGMLFAGFRSDQAVHSRRD